MKRFDEHFPTFKRFFYWLFVRSWISRLFNLPLLSITVPALVGLYYGTLDIWGEDWNWIKDYKSRHEVIFSILASGTIIVLFFRGVSEVLQSRVEKNYHIMLESMVAFINELVKIKRHRFQKKAMQMKPRADAFKLITHPVDQLEYIVGGTARLLRDAFGIDAKSIEITIIEGQRSQNDWHYMIKGDGQRQLTKARTLIAGRSTAAHCLRTGESLFVPDISYGEQQGLFLASERSRKANNVGSIYCKPVRVQVGTVECCYVFTICVYGAKICAPYDEAECRACERLLDEVAERAELELYLHSIKTYKEKG